MQLDKKSLDRLLSLSDDQVRVLLKKLLAEYGIDPATVPLAQLDVGRLREILRGATDEDIARFMELLSASGNQRGGA